MFPRLNIAANVSKSSDRINNLDPSILTPSVSSSERVQSYLARHVQDVCLSEHVGKASSSLCGSGGKSRNDDQPNTGEGKQGVRDPLVATPAMPFPFYFEGDDEAVVIIDLSELSTALATQLGNTGAGADRLRQIINPYFDRLIKTSIRYGGDIFKFAGDSMMVAWTLDTIEKATVRVTKNQQTVSPHTANSSSPSTIQLSPALQAYTCCLEMLHDFENLKSPTAQSAGNSLSPSSVTTSRNPTSLSPVKELLAASTPSLSGIGSHPVASTTSPTLSPSNSRPGSGKHTRENVPTLSIHVSLGVGKLQRVHVGLPGTRRECFLAGPALADASACLDEATKGELAMTAATWKRLVSGGVKLPSVRHDSENSEPEEDVKRLEAGIVWKTTSGGKSEHGKHNLDSGPENDNERNGVGLPGNVAVVKASIVLELLSRMNRIEQDLMSARSPFLASSPVYDLDVNKLCLEYVNEAMAIRLQDSMREMQYSVNMIRKLSIVFVKIVYFPSNNAVEGMSIAQSVMEAVIPPLNQFQGTMRQFNVDDKGATVLLVWGLPPLSHERESFFAMKAALQIRDKLTQLIPNGFSIGVTTGSTFTGSIGNEERSDHSVLGTVVNEAARLMCHQLAHGTILCDSLTHHETEKAIRFHPESHSIHIKGRDDNIDVYRPMQKGANNASKGVGSRLAGTPKDENNGLQGLIGRGPEQRVLTDGIKVWEQASRIASFPTLVEQMKLNGIFESEHMVRKWLLLGESGQGKTALGEYFSAKSALAEGSWNLMVAGREDQDGASESRSQLEFWLHVPKFQSEKPPSQNTVFVETSFIPNTTVQQAWGPERKKDDPAEPTNNNRDSSGFGDWFQDLLTDSVPSPKKVGKFSNLGEETTDQALPSPLLTAKKVAPQEPSLSKGLTESSSFALSNKLGVSQPRRKKLSHDFTGSAGLLASNDFNYDMRSKSHENFLQIQKQSKSSSRHGFDEGNLRKKVLNGSEISLSDQVKASLESLESRKCYQSGTGSPWDSMEEVTADPKQAEGWLKKAVLIFKESWYILPLFNELLGTRFRTNKLAKIMNSSERRELVASIISRWFNILTLVYQIPISLFLDDLQWQDEQSSPIITQILSDCPNVLVLITSRPLAQHSNKQSKTLESLSAKGILKTINLKDLSYDDMETLIKLKLEDSGVKQVDTKLCSEIYRRTNGNCFLVSTLCTSIAKLLIEEQDTVKMEFRVNSSGILSVQHNGMISQVIERYLPTDVDVVVSQFDRLSERFRRILAVASCIGQYFTLKTLWSVCMLDDEAQDFIGILSPEMLKAFLRSEDQFGFLIFEEDHKSQSNEVVIGNKHMIHFRHALIQKGIYGTVCDEDKIAMHLAAADHLYKDVLNEVNSDSIVPLIMHHASQVPDFEEFRQDMYESLVRLNETNAINNV
ncbi:Adenylate cyclase type 10 [Blyttiomyces sp. JEL0837]|nr:Adenylate cyclase type 10 [Blyttiomyces sp. JEL0837]